MAALNGRLDDALATLDQAASITVLESWDGAYIQIQRADVLVARGDTVGAEAALRAAIAGAGAVGGIAAQLQAATRLASLSTAGRRDGVLTLQSILPTLTEGLDTPIVAAGARCARDGTRGDRRHLSRGQPRGYDLPRTSISGVKGMRTLQAGQADATAVAPDTERGRAVPPKPVYNGATTVVTDDADAARIRETLYRTDESARATIVPEFRPDLTAGRHRAVQRPRLFRDGRAALSR